MIRISEKFSNFIFIQAGRIGSGRFSQLQQQQRTQEQGQRKREGEIIYILFEP